MRNIALALGSLVLLVWSAACGNDGLSSQVSFTVVPSRPVVITADYTLPSGTIVTHPWFSFSVNVANGSTESVIVVGLSMVVSGVSPLGNVVTATTSLGTTSLSTSFICNSNPPSTLALTTNPTFVAIPPGTQQTLQVSYVPAACPTGATNSPPTAAGAEFFLGQNPDPAQQQVVSYFYQVQLTPEGYFSADGTTPDTRLENVTTFVTQ